MTKDMRPRKMPKMAKPAKKKPAVEQAPPAGVVPPLPQVYSTEPERVLPNVKRVIPGRTTNLTIAWIVVVIVTIAFVVWAYVARN